MAPDSHAREILARVTEIQTDMTEVKLAVAEVKHCLFGVRDRGGLVDRVDGLETAISTRQVRKEDRRTRRWDYVLTAALSAAVAFITGAGVH
jgi:hypothetical protein